MAAITHVHSPTNRLTTARVLHIDAMFKCVHLKVFRGASLQGVYNLLVVFSSAHIAKMSSIAMFPRLCHFFPHLSSSPCALTKLLFFDQAKLLSSIKLYEQQGVCIYFMGCLLSEM